MKLFLEPNDVLMFRDGRPFSGGEDHFARGVCPPPPSTVYGALRSHILSVSWPEFDSFGKGKPAPPEVRQEIGSPTQMGSLRVGRFLLAKRSGTGIEPIFPIPGDVSQTKGDGKGTLRVLKSIDLPKETVKTSLPSGLLNLWFPTEDPLETPRGFLAKAEMVRYLAGEVPERTIPSDELFLKEERTGIRKGRANRAVEQGGIYTVQYFRLKVNVGFAVEVHDTSLLPIAGTLRFGGDNRSVSYRETPWEEIDPEPIKRKVAANRIFKIILISPAIFAQGWLPEGVFLPTMQGTIKDVPLEIVGAAVGRPIGVGGFDLVTGMPKVMKRAVPAGSVYYCRMTDGDVGRLFDRLWLKPISDERGHEGFGISLIGGVAHV